MPRTLLSLTVLGLAAAMLAASPAHALIDENDLHGVERLASMSENTRGALDKAQRKLEHALESLKFLMDTDIKNAKNAYQKFKDDTQEFRSQVVDAQNKIADVTEDSALFFASWEESDALMTSDRARARSERRRTAAQAAFQQHLNAFSEAKDVFEPALALLTGQVNALDENYDARIEPSVAEAHANGVRMADDTYWIIDNAIAKTELFD